jgi:hypothetical protein
MFCLRTVMHALVQPWGIRLFLALPLKRFNMGEGVLMYTRVPLFHWQPLAFWVLIISSCRPTLVSCASLWLLYAPFCYFVVIRLVSYFRCCNLPLFCLGSFLEYGQTSHSANMQVAIWLFGGWWNGTGLPRMSRHSFPWVWPIGTRSAAWGPSQALHRPFSLLHGQMHVYILVSCTAVAASTSIIP